MEVDKTKHHQAKVFALAAIDFAMVGADGSLYRGTGQKLEDYYGCDSVITAAADGTVRMVEQDYPDLPPGVGGKFDEANSIGIEHFPLEWTDYAHIRQGSALFHVGDTVKAGQPIARVGNSGASGRPHLHFTLDTPVKSARVQEGWMMEFPKHESRFPGRPQPQPQVPRHRGATITAARPRRGSPLSWPAKSLETRRADAMRWAQRDRDRGRGKERVR